MTTKEKLAKALAEFRAPQVMIKKAICGAYDDFESGSATPLSDLVNDCAKHGLFAFADRVKSGEFDDSKEEGEAWMEKEGKKLWQEIKNENMH